MENNILQTLSSILSKNNPSGGAAQQTQGAAQQMQGAPLYPMEAYPQQASASTLGDTSAQNGILPLLLTILGQNGSPQAVSKMLSENNPDMANILSLFSNLPKKKKHEEEKKEEEQKTFVGTLCRDEFL